MAKRKKINLKQLLTDADELLIPRAELVMLYKLKNKASLRSMLSVARNKFGQKSPNVLRRLKRPHCPPREETKIKGKVPGWMMEKMTSTSNLDPLGLRPKKREVEPFEYSHLSSESARLRGHYIPYNKELPKGCLIYEEKGDVSVGLYDWGICKEKKKKGR